MGEEIVLNGGVVLAIGYSLVAAVVTAIVEIVKPLYLWLEIIIDKREIPVEIDLIVAQTVAIALAFGANLNVFEVAGIPFAWPAVGCVVTGLLLSKGSNFVHDLLSKIK